MGDLIGFEGFLNTTTPFRLEEHKVVWKSNRRYLDFDIGNNYKPKCDYPRFWLESGKPVGKGVTDRMVGCYDSEFDQVRIQNSTLRHCWKHSPWLTTNHLVWRC